MRLGRSLGMRLGRSLEPGNEAGEEPGNMDGCSPSSVTHQLVCTNSQTVGKGKEDVFASGRRCSTMAHLSL